MNQKSLGEAIENRADYNNILRVMELLMVPGAKVTVETTSAEESIQIDKINHGFWAVLMDEAARLEKEFEKM